MGKRFMQWVGLIGLCYGALVLALFVFQRGLLYPAAKDRPQLSEWAAPGFGEVTTQPEAGLDLLHWYRPPQHDCGPVVVVFHGNAGHIGHRVEKYAALYRAGFGLFLSGYRGYGSNPGQPSEAGLTADGRSVVAWLEASGVTPERTVLYGESLGTGVAVALASEKPFAALVLEAPPSSVADVAQAHYWYVPAKWLIWDKWNSLARIKAVRAPLLLLHGARDRVVPQRFGRKLFAAANEPKEALFPENGGHVDLLDLPKVERRVVEFIEETARDAAGASRKAC